MRRENGMHGWRSGMWAAGRAALAAGIAAPATAWSILLTALAALPLSAADYVFLVGSTYDEDGAGALARNWSAACRFSPTGEQLDLYHGWNGFTMPVAVYRPQDGHFYLTNGNGGKLYRLSASASAGGGAWVGGYSPGNWVASDNVLEEVANLAGTYYASGGAVTPEGDLLFVVQNDDNAGVKKVTGLNPGETPTVTTLIAAADMPGPDDDGYLAVDPDTGAIFIGDVNTTNVCKYSADGTLVDGAFVKNVQASWAGGGGIAVLGDHLYVGRGPVWGLWRYSLADGQRDTGFSVPLPRPVYSYTLVTDGVDIYVNDASEIWKVSTSGAASVALAFDAGYFLFLGYHGIALAPDETNEASRGTVITIQ